MEMDFMVRVLPLIFLAIIVGAVIFIAYKMIAKGTKEAIKREIEESKKVD